MKHLKLFLFLVIVCSCNQGNNTTVNNTIENMTVESPNTNVAATSAERVYKNETVATLDRESLQVLSAVIKDKVIADAEVIFQRTGKQSQVTRTNAEGLTTIPPDFVDDTESIVIIKKEGYSTLVAKCPCKGLTYAISPKLQNLDGIRVVLNWGYTPRDLDLHVRYGGEHVYYSEMVADNANLDVDDTDSYGPETITIEKKEFDEKYSFFVHDFTNRFEPLLKELSDSQAKIFVYIGESQIQSFYVPQNIQGNVWHVFDFAESGEIVVVNKVYKSKDSSADVLEEGRTYTESTFDNQITVSDDVVAKRYNKLGEKAYHNGDLEQAIEHYRKAIAYNVNFGQAYSNLGLAYYKNANKAEALWANRKAIALASGTAKHITIASSYFNNAKIYEDEGEFEEALRYYKMAKESNDRSAYDKAINRVKALMN